jgi:hypothetical protein
MRSELMGGETSGTRNGSPVGAVSGHPSVSFISASPVENGVGRIGDCVQLAPC